MGKLVLAKQPALRAPYLLAGFGGWPNGGDVSTETVQFVQSALEADPIGEITADDLYIYSSPTLASRPIVSISHGVLQSLSFPVNTIYAWQHPHGGDHDLLFLQGVEPDLHWEQFAAAIVECVEVFQVQRLYTIGGYLDHAPHTRVPRISAVVTQPALRTELRAYEVDLTDYEGPTSIQSYLLARCQERGIEGISLWGSTPSYIQGGYPRVIQAMLQLLQQMWHLPLNLSPIEAQAAELEATLHEQIDSNPELAEYIKRLEHAYDLAEHEESDMEDTDGIVDEIQQFLRQRRTDRPDHDAS
jgi:proteasome assembly chaperone (PAC2) family protein